MESPRQPRGAGYWDLSEARIPPRLRFADAGQRLPLECDPVLSILHRQFFPILIQAPEEEERDG